MRLAASQEKTKMALQAAALGVLVAVEAAEVLRAAGEVALGGGPQYLRDGAPIGAVAQAGLQAARYACRRYGSNPGQYPSDTAANYEKACRPYLEDIGEGEGPSLELPFRGGQCDGQAYDVLITGVRADNGCNVNPGTAGANGVIGPISIRRRVDTTFLDQVGGLCPGFSINTVEVIDRSGGVAATFGQVRGVRVDSISVTPQSGTDDCGNPEPEFEEPKGPGITIGPITPIFIDNTFDVDASVNVNLDGTIEFNFGLGPISVDPFGDAGEGGGGGPEPPGAPTIGPVTPGGNGGFGGDDELGEPPAGQRWVGIAMAITNRPEDFGVIPTTTADKVYPTVVGNARLIYNAFGFEVVGTPVQIRSDRVTLWEEVRGANPVALRVNLQAGFGYSYFGIAQPDEN